MSKAVVSRLLKVALTVVVLAVAAHYVQPEKAISTMLAVHPLHLGCAVLLIIPNLYLQQLKWLKLLRRFDGAASSTHAWHSLLAGFPLGLATPGRWGELGRAIFLPAYPRPAIAALAAADKLMNFVAVVSLGAVGAMVLFQSGCLPELSMLPAPSSVVLVLFLSVVLLSPRILRMFLNRGDEQDRSTSWIRLVLDFETSFLFQLFTLSLLFVLTFCAQLLILVAGLQPVDASTGFAAASATFFAQSLLPLSIGDLGIRESAAAYFFGKIGVAPHAAFGAALLLFVINMLLPSALGLLLLWKNPLKLRS